MVGSIILELLLRTVDIENICPSHSIAVSLFLTVMLIYPLIVETSPGIVHMNLFCMMGAHVLFPGGPLFFCPADDSSINC